MDKKKRETPKRKVVQVKPKQKKNTVDFSKFFNFLSFVVFVVFAFFMYKKVVQQEKIEQATIENTSKEITSTMDIRNENFYNEPKKKVKEEVKMPKETTEVDNIPKEEVKTEDKPKTTETVNVSTTEKKEETREEKVPKDKKVSDAKKLEEGKETAKKVIKDESEKKKKL